MADYTPIQQNTGSFVPTTDVWDVSRLHEVNVNSPEFKELLVRLYQNVNNIALVLNNKVSGYNLLEEFITSKVYFPNPTIPLPTVFDLRPSYNIVVNFGAVGPGVTVVAHNIPFTTTYIVVDIKAIANKTTAPFAYYPLTWASAGGANNIELKVDGTNITITNNSGVAFDTCYVIMEYLKN
jgi:hypothetical protein